MCIMCRLLVQCGTCWDFCICVATLLGMAPHTFYKYIHDQPDRRKGMLSVVGHDRPQRRACDQFFAELYMPAAEHLPEQCLDPDNSATVLAQYAQVGGLADSSASIFQARLVDTTMNPDETLNTEAPTLTAGEVNDWPQHFVQHGFGPLVVATPGWVAAPASIIMRRLQ